MRRLAIMLTVGATVAAGLTAVPAQAATVPSPPTTAYDFFTAARPGLDWGTSFQSTNGVTGSSLPGGGLTVQGTNAALAFSGTDVRPPTGQSFAVGSYDINETATDTLAGVSINGTGPAECATTSGTLTVHEVTLVAGEVTAFAGSVRGNCGAGVPAFAQEIRWNSTVPSIVLSTPVSTPKTEVVTVQAGASDVTFGTAVGTGTDTKVVISNDGCSGQTVLANQSCSLTLTATPDFFGPAQDTFTLPDGGAGRKIPVTVNGLETAIGAYTPLAPARLLDTRNALGVTTRTPIGPGQVVDLQVTGREGVPAAGASAVVLNVTVVAPTAAGFVTLYPTGPHAPPRRRSTSTRASPARTWSRSSSAPAARSRFYNKSGSTHVVADVMGYYHGASSTATDGYGGYSAVEPTRILDTRLATARRRRAAPRRLLPHGPGSTSARTSTRTSRASRSTSR